MDTLPPTYAPFPKERFHTHASRGKKTKNNKPYLSADTFKTNFCPKSKSGNFIWLYLLWTKDIFTLLMIRLYKSLSKIYLPHKHSNFMAFLNDLKGKKN